MAQEIKQMTFTEELRQRIETASSRHQSVSMELRIQFAQLITRLRIQKGWTQQTLAERSGLQPSHISELAHADENCTLETIGKVFFALGIRGRLLAVAPDPVDGVSAAGVPILLNTKNHSTFGVNIYGEDIWIESRNRSSVHSDRTAFQARQSRRGTKDNGPYFTPHLAGRNARVVSP